MLAREAWVVASQEAWGKRIRCYRVQLTLSEAAAGALGLYSLHSEAKNLRQLQLLPLVCTACIAFTQGQSLNKKLQIIQLPNQQSYGKCLRVYHKQFL